MHLKALKLPGWVREFRFDPDRKWQFDFCRRDLKLAVEIEGGTASGKSRHSKGKGFDDDCEKYNAAAIAGWRFLRGSAEMVSDGRLLRTVERALGGATPNRANESASRVNGEADTEGGTDARDGGADG